MTREPTKAELIAAGWKKATPEEVAAAKIDASGLSYAEGAGQWCYSQPCESGGLTCFTDENGNCNDCYKDPMC